MRYLALHLALFAAFVTSCKDTESTSDLRSAGPAGADATAELVPGGSPTLAAFAWSTSDLAQCYSGRNGMKVYVYSKQATMTCNATTSSWQ